MTIEKAHRETQAARDSLKGVDEQQYAALEDRLTFRYVAELLDESERLLFILGNKTEPTG